MATPLPIRVDAHPLHTVEPTPAAVPRRGARRNRKPKQLVAPLPPVGLPLARPADCKRVGGAGAAAIRGHLPPVRRLVGPRGSRRGHSTGVSRRAHVDAASPAAGARRAPQRASAKAMAAPTDAASSAGTRRRSVLGSSRQAPGRVNSRRSGGEHLRAEPMSTRLALGVARARAAAVRPTDGGNGGRGQRRAGERVGVTPAWDDAPLGRAMGREKQLSGVARWGDA